MLNVKGLDCYHCLYFTGVWLGVGSPVDCWMIHFLPPQQPPFFFFSVLPIEIEVVRYSCTQKTIQVSMHEMKAQPSIREGMTYTWVFLNDFSAHLIKETLHVLPRLRTDCHIDVSLQSLGQVFCLFLANLLAFDVVAFVAHECHHQVLHIDLLCHLVVPVFRCRECVSVSQIVDQDYTIAALYVLLCQGLELLLACSVP